MDERSAAERNTADEEVHAPQQDAVTEASLTPDELYEQGMTHYRRREWEEALDCFTRLKALDPGRRGIDALLSELQIFIQLQEIGPENDREEPTVAQTVSASAKQGRSPKTTRGPQARRLLLMVIGVVALVAALLVGARIARPFLSANQQRTSLTELYNRGQARLAVEDYEGAIAAFEELLAQSPEDKRAQVALERAQRLRTVNQLYREAQELIAIEDWEAASQKLASILSIAPDYRDSRSVSAYVEKQRRLITLYNEGVEYHDQGAWAQARQRFEEVDSIDSKYRAESVQQYLFVAYLNEGLSLIAGERDSLDVAQQAVDRFGDALRLNPRNERAVEERRRAAQYLEAYTAFDRGRWQEAINHARSLYNLDPQYASGKLAMLIYRSYVELGQAYEAEGNDVKALQAYQSALLLPVADPSVALAREDALVARLYTPTPSPTATRTPTRTPTITPTRRPVTATLVPTITPFPTTPPQPTSPPPPTRDRDGDGGGGGEPPHR